MLTIILISWAAFAGLIYLALWFDTIYYRCNLPQVCRNVLNAFTEEDEEDNDEA